MNFSRLFVQGLAIVVAIVGGLWAFGSSFFLISISTGRLPGLLSNPGRSAWMFFSGAAAVTSVLGYLVIRQAWKHLRRPDRATANTVSGIASIFVGFEVVYLLVRWHLWPNTRNVLGTVAQLALLYALVFAIYLFYRRILKPIAGQAFPDNDLSSTPPPSGSGLQL